MQISLFQILFMTIFLSFGFVFPCILALFSVQCSPLIDLDQLSNYGPGSRRQLSADPLQIRIQNTDVSRTGHAALALKD
jgi:hypothetical protein